MAESRERVVECLYENLFVSLQVFHSLVEEKNAVQDRKEKSSTCNNGLVSFDVENIYLLLRPYLLSVVLFT